MPWKRWVFRFLNLTVTVLILFAAVDLLYAFLSPLSTGSDLAYQTIARNDLSDPPVYVEGFMLNEFRQIIAADDPPLSRLTMMEVTTQTVNLTFQLTVPETNRLAEDIISGYVRLHAHDFLAAAFGELAVNRQRLSDAQINLVSWEVEPESRHVTVTIMVNEAPEDSVSLEGMLTDIRPAQDQVRLELDQYVLQRLVPDPDMYQDGVAQITLDDGQTYLSVTAVALDPRPSTSVRPTPTTTARESRQAFLRRLGAIIDVPFFRALAFGLLELLPLLIFIYWVRTADSPPPFAQAMVAPFTGLLLFHFTLYVLAGGNDFFGDTRLWEWIVDRWPAATNLFYDINYNFDLGRGPIRISALILGLWLPAVLRHKATPPLQKQRGRRLLTLILTLIISAGIIYPLAAFWGKWADSWQGYLTGDAAVPAWALMLTGASLLVLLISWLLRHLYTLVVQSPPRPGTMLFITFLLVFTACYESLRAMSRPLPGVNFVWPILSTGLSLSLLYALAVTLRPLLTTAVPDFKLARWQQRLLWLLGLLLAIPMISFVDPGRTGFTSYETDLLSLAYRLDDIIFLVWLACIVWLLYQETSQSPEILPFVRKVGILALTSLIFSPTIRWLYIPINFLLGWLLLDRFVRQSSHWEKLQPILQRVFTQRQQLLDQIVDLSVTQKAFKVTRDELRQKLTDKDKPITLEAYHEKLQEMRADLEKLEDDATIARRSIRDVALTFGPYASAWRNGLHGAVYGLLLGLPWIIISLRAFLVEPMPLQTYPLWGLLLGLVTIFLNWTGRGFFFGYFYPYLRGSNGLQKGLFFLAVSIVPTLPLMALDNTTADAWQASLYWVLQIFVHTMLLGLFAFDYLTLRQGRNHDWRMLFEVHGITSVGASVSTIVVALGTAITTLTTNQAVSLAATALKFIFPETQIDIPPPGG